MKSDLTIQSYSVGFAIGMYQADGRGEGQRYNLIRSLCFRPEEICRNSAYLRGLTDGHRTKQNLKKSGIILPSWYSVVVFHETVLSAINFRGSEIPE